MKKRDLLFVVIVMAIWFGFTHTNCGKELSLKLDNMIIESLPATISEEDTLESNASDWALVVGVLAEDYGVLSDGSFFISSDLVGENSSNPTLTILEYRADTSAHFTREYRMVIEEIVGRETITMEKVGKYYFGKSTKDYSNPMFYFSFPGYIQFPYNAPEKFKSKDIVVNQCAGLLLNL